MNLANYLSGTAETPPAPLDDTALEGKLFLFMGQLEQEVMRLTPVAQDGDYTANVEIAKDLLVDILEFAEQNFEAARLESHFDRAAEFHELTRHFERLLGSNSWNGLISFFGMKATIAEGVPEAYGRWTDEFTVLVHDFCTAFVNHFQAAEKVTEWNASLSVLLGDMKKHW